MQRTTQFYASFIYYQAQQQSKSKHVLQKWAAYVTVTPASVKGSSQAAPLWTESSFHEDWNTKVWYNIILTSAWQTDKRKEGPWSRRELLRSSGAGFAFLTSVNIQWREKISN